MKYSDSKETLPESLRYRGSLLCNAIDNRLEEKENKQEFKNNIKLHIDFINDFLLNLKLVF